MYFLAIFSVGVWFIGAIDTTITSYHNTNAATRLYVLKQKTLPAELATKTVAGLKSTCNYAQLCLREDMVGVIGLTMLFIRPTRKYGACQYLCLTFNCKTYSVTKTTPTNITCSVSEAHVPLSALLEQGSDSYAAYKTDYELYGTHFYKIGEEAMKRGESDKSCVAEGANLAIAHTEELVQEIKNFLIYKGVTKAWVNLRMYKIPDGIMDILPNTPFWQFENGSYIIESILQLTGKRCFHVDLDRYNNDDIFYNDLTCNSNMQFICQLN